MICIILVASLRDRLQRELEAEALRNGNQQDFVHLPRSLLPVDGDDSILDLWWAVISKERSITNVFIVTNAIHYKVRAENHCGDMCNVSCVRLNLPPTTTDRHPVHTHNTTRHSLPRQVFALCTHVCGIAWATLVEAPVLPFVDSSTCAASSPSLSHTLLLSLTCIHPPSLTPPPTD